MHGLFRNKTRSKTTTRRACSPGNNRRGPATAGMASPPKEALPSRAFQYADKTRCESCPPQRMSRKTRLHRHRSMPALCDARPIGQRRHEPPRNRPPLLRPRNLPFEHRRHRDPRDKHYTSSPIRKEAGNRNPKRPYSDNARHFQDRTQQHGTLGFECFFVGKIQSPIGTFGPRIAQNHSRQNGTDATEKHRRQHHRCGARGIRNQSSHTDARGRPRIKDACNSAYRRYPCRDTRFMRKIRLHHLPAPFQHGTHGQPSISAPARNRTPCSRCAWRPLVTPQA